jgi:TolB-like protein
MRVFPRCRLIHAGAAVFAAVLVMADHLVGQDEESDTRPGVAVLRFESGGSLGSNPEDLGALEVGIQQMLLTELSQRPELRIVERSHLNAILQEQDLGASGRVEVGTEAEAGRLIGARFMVAGVFTDVSGEFRLDARVFDVETSEILRCEEVRDRRERMYDLIVDLAEVIAADLHLPALDTEAQAALEARRAREIPPEALTLYAWGQIFEDRGHLDMAGDAYRRVMSEYPDLTEARDDWRRLLGSWELNVFVGSFNDEPSEYVVVPGSEDNFRRDAVLGVRVAYHLPLGLFVQGEIANSLVRVPAPNGTIQNMNVTPILASGGYSWHVRHDLHLFGAVGLGGMRFEPDRTRSEIDFAAVYGAGARVFLTRNHVIRGDLRLHQIPNALGKTLDDLGVPRGDTLWLLELSAGLSWFPGGG